MDEFTENRGKYYKKIRDDCLKILEKSAFIQCVRPQSAFYLFIDISRLKISDKLFCNRLLEEYGTVMTPGSSFGCGGFVRASFCGKTEDVKKDLQQLVKFAGALCG
jgi:aspartate aminotransferase